MAKTMHRKLRILCRLILGSVFLLASCAAAWYWSDRLSPTVQTLRRIVGIESASPAAASEPVDLERARAVQRQLRDRLNALQAERRDVASQVRLLQAGTTLALTQGRADGEETRRRLQRDSHFYTRQLSEIESQIESTQRTLERLDRLVQQLQLDATIERADRDTLLRATELLWTHDPGRSGPNAVVPASDWELEIAEE